MSWEKVSDHRHGGLDSDASSCAAGFVLAGGLSSRMGQNKALLSFQGQTLIGCAVGKLAQVCDRVAIAGGGPDLAPYGRVIPDQYMAQGPLGGIVAALEQTDAEWNLFLAVDMPLVPVAALRKLLSVSGEPCLVTLARADGFVQPLCGVYSRRALPVLRAELLKGNRRVRAAVEATGSFGYWQAAKLDWFANLNTPEEFATAELSASSLDL